MSPIREQPVCRRKTGPVGRYEAVVTDVLSLLTLGPAAGNGRFSVWYGIKRGEVPRKVRCAIRNAVLRNLSDEDRDEYQVVSSVQENDAYVVVTLEKKSE